jgi:chorismate dehydratase
MWIARPDLDLTEVADVLAAARDKGVRRLTQIATREAAAMQIPNERAFRYLHDNLHFTLGRRERQGLRMFYQHCVARGLAPPGLEGTLETIAVHDCPAN